MDVTGGWHDATDYLQYTATSSNAIFQLLFAYRENPTAFGDAYQSNGMPGSNGVPDIIDEAKFGMDWLKKMNPKSKNELISKSFMKKACEPNEVANLILFLSSKNSQYINGQIIFLDGGMEC